MGLCGRVFQIRPGLCASGHIDIGLYYDLWSLSPLFNSINRKKTRFFLDGYLLWKFSFSCFCLIFSFVFDLFILKCLSTFFFGFIWIMIVMSAISLMKLVEYLWVWKKNLILWIGIRKYVKCTLWLTSKTRHYWGQEGKMIQMYKLQILIREARALLKDLPGNCPVSSDGNFPLCSYAFYMYLQMEHFINALHRLWYVKNHAVGHWLCVADFYWGGDSLEELS